jgi:predicted Zn finger-like uncharacterized protein
MYSQCPECLTRFRVTAAALRAAHGTVRCGRCGSAFDALVYLSDTLPEATETDGTLRAPALVGLAGTDEHVVVPREDVADDGATQFHFSADDIERVFVDARDWPRRNGGATGGAAPAVRDSGLPEELYVHEPEAVEDITLEGERIVIDGLPDDEDELVAAALAAAPGVVAPAPALPPEAPAAVPDGSVQSTAAPAHDLDSTDRFEILRLPEDALASASDDDERFVPDGAAAATERAGAAAPLPVEPETFEFDAEHAAELAAAAERGRQASLAWGLGALVLALVLVGQLVHHFRRELARDPYAGPAVRAVYERLGRPLSANWQLAAFELRQWGASEAPEGGRLTVRASVRNRASYAQPMPLLRLELEDRYGGTVARRDFEPREYLKDPAQGTRRLGAGAHTEAELVLVDVAREAVGYRLDVCLREDGGTTRCAQPAKPARTGP